MSPTPRKPKAEAETNDDDALYTPTGCKEAYEKLERFPSIKREQVLAEIKQEFHKNKAGWAGVGRRLQSGA
ncbi:hypothetical protein F751_5997 [Auxenochlorella protothecoides]|uniref:Uncharacterized protein n=1 Tax=Auxenochlorella protothecoides TaxID=3075 RepID=A0A087SCI9_AUXPR|nr:hypothetical protein F751_5997 [Auxenochlorella protothecoides]KFM23443.1 hypothetical protein F751_5997 [Auxenochlorella protothecoides]RMZ55913.1 hypothetical protein APUTEX25_004337 [Auxenochlorella protothecoides]|eukprot:RMZ55913.1 hypothetical protein APUTEX25_004337 [Auxenochlorella protothecoides]